MSTTMTDWALNASTRFVEQERIRSEKWAKAAQRHHALVAQAPVVWQEILEALQTQVRSFNDAVGQQVMIASKNSDNKFAVYAHTDTGARSMAVEFDPQRHCIACSARSAGDPVDFEDRLSIALNSDDIASIALATGVECSREQAAGHMLNGLMGWNQPIT